MVWKPELYVIFLPDPYDPDGAWTKVSDFPTKSEAVQFVMEKLGGNSAGELSTVSFIPDEGWIVDLPNPHDLEGAWILQEVFRRKRDAVRFVHQNYGGDAEGYVPVIDVLESYEPEQGPKDWSPREER